MPLASRVMFEDDGECSQAAPVGIKMHKGPPTLGRLNTTCLKLTIVWQRVLELMIGDIILRSIPWVLDMDR